MGERFNIHPHRFTNKYSKAMEEVSTSAGCFEGISCNDHVMSFRAYRSLSKMAKV